MKELVFPETFQLCSPKESCMKEFVFLEMFEMCIPKEQRSSMALLVLSRKATVQNMSGLQGHCYCGGQSSVTRMSAVALVWQTLTGQF